MPDERDPRLGRGWPTLQDVIRPDWRSRPALVSMTESMLMVDGPAHTRLRKLVSRAFTARTIERLRPAVAARARDLLAPMLEAGGGDLMEELAFPLPAQVIADLLGVPATGVPQFRSISRTLVDQFEVTLTQSQLAARLGASRQRVNGVLGDFERRGWIVNTGSRPSVADRAALLAFLEG